MCFFVAIGIKTRSIELIEKAMKPNLVFSPVRNPNLNCCLSKGYSFCWVISNGCSCELLPEPPLNRELLGKKYKKLGWSNGKIKRVIDEKEVGINYRAKNLKIEKILERVIEWSNPLYFFYHWFNSEIDTEEIKNIDNIEISFEDFKILDIRKNEDKLLKIQRK
jgi:hypothetical protein